MKTSLTFLMYVLTVSLLMPGRLSAQTGPDRNPGSLHMFTDRNMYITGEAISFSAVNLSDKDAADRVVYVEMITPDGKQVIGGKYMLTRGTASGCLYIPEELLTGLYYVRAYTRYMRNAGPKSYDYVPVKVINPVKSEIPAPGNGNSIFAAGKDSVLAGLFDIAGLKRTYGTRETVDLSVRTTNGGASLIKGICVTIIPEKSANNLRMKVLSGNAFPENKGVYYAETAGLTLTGKLMDKEQTSALTDRIVTLSVMGDKDFSAYKTDRNGRFFFTLPDDTGKRDIFLSSVDLTGSGSSLLIDNDFCSEAVELPSPEFRLTDQEKATALALAVNARINNSFNGRLLRPGDTLARTRKPFYGQPTSTLFMDKFIQLPTLQEYFDEISLEVKIRERNGGKYFKFVSGEAGMMVNDPLILVDWVVINDMKKILSLVPQKILKIETVNKPYVKGNLTYGGIISILSRDGDFAGIDLPASGVFVKYDFFAPGCPVSPTAAGSHMPDSRNTLLWIPQLNAEPGHESAIHFVTPDAPGSYEILLRGVLPDGNAFCQTFTFEVTAR
jgi:hypothetical protein